MILGHRQVTDAWLAQRARRSGGRVGALDTAFAQKHPDVATLIRSPRVALAFPGQFPKPQTHFQTVSEPWPRRPT